MRKRIIIIGAGGHARSILDVLLLASNDILGFTAPNRTELHKLAYLGTDRIIFDQNPEAICLVLGIGSSGKTLIRQTLYNTFKQKKYTFRTVIHPNTTISRTASFGEGVQVMAGAIIQAGVSIGNNTIINTGAIIDHDCIIDQHVHISPGSVLSGGVTIGYGSHVGAGATIIQGVKVGQNCIIGAGAVVIRDVADNSVCVGVPACEVKKSE